MSDRKEREAGVEMLVGIEWDEQQYEEVSTLLNSAEAQKLKMSKLVM